MATHKQQQGFTLLEVLITISLLAFMVIAISSLMRGSVDMRLGLSEQTQVISRLNTAMHMMKKDLEHTYMLSVNYDKHMIMDGVTNTFFKVTSFGGQTTVSFTTMNAQNNYGDAQRGELITVEYEVKESERFPGRLALFRGEMTLGFDGEITTRLVVEGIESFTFEMWNGDGWLSTWDTEKSDFKQSIPRLVRVAVRAYPTDPESDDPSAQNSIMDVNEPGAFAERRTIVLLPWARRFIELKDKTKTLRL
ncbi:MAG: prepilin-type N-terminal cleavage/methylation domain-containing protein [Proteobacteria bacterium]|nr:prepilin-type N-terminal cleavage/methylation domain-containing protein [Pseudomonadota bacterium]